MTRVLVVHRDPLPRPDAPASGAGLRAQVHVDALRGAGHEVVRLRRVSDEVLGAGSVVAGEAASAGALRAAARALAPDWILCVSPADAPALSPVAPLVVDLYAPRMLEAAFQGRQRAAALEAARAVHHADEVLFSTERQRWFWMGVLGAAGWDLSRPAGRVVPLAALPLPDALREAPRASPPRFVAGGMDWPWQDARPALRAAAKHLAGRAEVHTYGLPPIEGTIAHGPVSRAAWIEACATATAAIDRYAPSPERPLAYRFRQADYLGAGLPVILDPDAPLAPEVRALGAGWVDEPLDAALDAALVEDRRAGARALGARYHPERTEAPLLEWEPARRRREWSVLAAGERVARAEEELRRARDRARLLGAERDKKQAEVDALVRQGQALAASVEALSAAMLDVASFRKEAVTVLGARLGGEAATNEQLAREVEVLRADLAKKEAELAALTRDRDRLGRALDWLRRK